MFRHEIQDPDTPVTFKQSRKIYFETNKLGHPLDTRTISGFTKGEASVVISELLEGNPADAINTLRTRGASQAAPHQEGPSPAERDGKFEVIFKSAHEAGLKAGTDAVPTPMIVQGYEPISDGVCGFAWINVKPGTSKFAHWLKRTDRARSAYGGGLDIWVSEFNQSLTRKEAYAFAFAAVLETAGINALSQSRID
jgi:hypothetical protein